MPKTEQGVGWKKRDTSRHAAEDMDRKVGTIRSRVLAAFSAGAQMTSEEVSFIIGKRYVSVQPRVSELADDGYLEDSGKRKMGRFQKMIIVWQRTDKKHQRQGSLDLEGEAI